MAHCFKVSIDGEIKEYTRFEDIPKEFDNLICFKPEFIPPPHTEEEHRKNEIWEVRFKELMQREKK